MPGDNSVDLYTNDIGLVVITNDAGELQGFNVMVGGGMGRTHNKEQSFPRAADHLGFVAKDDVLELIKVRTPTGGTVGTGTLGGRSDGGSLRVACRSCADADHVAEVLLSSLNGLWLCSASWPPSVTTATARSA